MVNHIDIYCVYSWVFRLIPILLIKNTLKPGGLKVLTSKPRSQNIEADKLLPVQGQLDWHSNFQATLDYKMVRFCINR